MLCPQCQIPLTVSKRISVEVNYCPQCHGIWLEQNVLEKIIVQIQLVDKSEQSLSNSETTQKKDNIQDKEAQIAGYKKRKLPHFLDAALDIYDDW